MADSIHGNTELGATKQALIAAAVQRELIEGSVVASRCMDVSMFCEPGAKSIEFPKAGSMTVADRAEGAAGDAQVLTFATDKMDLDKNAYVAWIVDYMSAIQSRVSTQVVLAQRAASAHAKYLDDQLVTAIFAAGDETATEGVISKAILLEMRKTYLDRNGRLDSSTLLVGTDSEALLLNIDDFINASKFGNVVIPSGVIGKIYGMNVVVSNKVAANNFALFENSAIAYGFQAGASYSEQGANQYGSQAKRCVLDQIFGVKAMYINQAGAGASESALIIKSNPAA